MIVLICGILFSASGCGSQESDKSGNDTSSTVFNQLKESFTEKNTKKDTEQSSANASSTEAESPSVYSQNVEVSDFNDAVHRQAGTSDKEGRYYLPAFLEAGVKYYPLDSCLYETTFDGSYRFQQDAKGIIEDPNEYDSKIDVREICVAYVIPAKTNNHIQTVVCGDRIVWLNSGDIQVSIRKIDPQKFHYTKIGNVQFDDNKTKLRYYGNLSFTLGEIQSYSDYIEFSEIDGQPVKDFNHIKKWYKYSRAPFDDELSENYMFDYPEPKTVDVTYYVDFNEQHTALEINDIIVMPEKEEITIDWKSDISGYKYFYVPKLDPGLYALSITNDTALSSGRYGFVIQVSK